jgi:hypothetical protein
MRQRETQAEMNVENMKTMLAGAIRHGDRSKDNPRTETLTASIYSLTGDSPVDINTADDNPFHKHVTYARMTPSGGDMFHLLRDLLDGLDPIVDIRLEENDGTWETDEVIVVVDDV